MSEPEIIYKQKIGDLQVRLNRLERFHTFLGFFKLLLLLSGAAVLVKVARDFSWSLFGYLGGTSILFLAAALVHGRVLRRRQELMTAITIAEDEIRSLHGAWLDFYHGETFLEEDHPYDADLHLFGPRSVYHALNRTSTSMGAATLAGWLKRHPGEDLLTFVEGRQRAVEHLADQLDFRHAILVRGKSISDSPETARAFQDLFREPYVVYTKTTLIRFMRIWSGLTLACIGLIVLKITWIPWLIGMAVQMIVNKALGKKVLRAFRVSARHWRIINAYGHILKEIEQAEFECEELKEVQKGLYTTGKAASEHIKKLSTLLGYFEMRSSHIFHFILNNMVFWDLNCVLWIERWRERVGGHVDRWFDVIGRIEALSSLATLKFNNPDWVQPQFAEGPMIFEAEELGHPLIPRSERVCNSLSLRPEEKIVMVTGPNMAGKTTLLKSVGVNVILANAGAPVCARRFKLTRLNLYTSMKVTDSLDKHLSLFYAELRRLKMILDAIDRKEPVFFLIDEMLKGTNEVDRHQGAKALIGQLAGSAIPGFIATHDLGLTEMSRDFPDRIINVHFDGNVKEGRLLFDFLLRPGVCQSSNALELMEGIGIRLDKK